MTATLDTLPWLNVGLLSDGRTLQANGRIVKGTSGSPPRPDLSEAEALSLIALRQLTWVPPRTTGKRTRRGRWYNPAGFWVPVDSQTEAWISFWQKRSLVRLNGHLGAEFGAGGWRAYRRLLNRSLTPLELFHERWSRCRSAKYYADYVVAAADADYCVGALAHSSGPIVDRWLDHAERSLSALDAVGTIRAVHLDAVQDGAESQ